MSRNAQVEEMSDSDPEEVAPSLVPSRPNDSMLPGASVPSGSMPMGAAPEPQREIPKSYQCLYPIYFDKARTRAEGRKVGAELAVENPLARDIVDAVQMLGLRVGFEPEKVHPKDWANPGRVRVQLKNESGRPISSQIKNSRFLYFCSDGDILLFMVGQSLTVDRASPLHPCRPIPKSSPHHRSIAVPSAYSRVTDARKAT